MAKKKKKMRVDHLLIVLLVPAALIVLVIFLLTQVISCGNSSGENQVSTEQNIQTADSSAADSTVVDTAQKQEEERKKREAEEKKLKEQEELNTVKETSAGSQVDVSELDQGQIDQLFYAQDISDEQLASMEGLTYVSDQDFITPQDLRLIRVLYKDYNGSDCVGELIVNEKIAEDTIGVFKDLYDISYPVGKIVLPDLYGGDDNLSMADNNTSAFSFRLSDGVGIAIHEHSLGLAIDLNPLQNPQVIDNNGEILVFPYQGEAYADRTNVQDHMITNSDPAYQVFTEHGFSWGGDWNIRQDYMHFEKDYDPSMYQVVGDA